MVLKCLKETVPDSLSDYFTENESFHHYITRKKTDLHLPRVKRELGSGRSRGVQLWLKPRPKFSNYSDNKTRTDLF